MRRPLTLGALTLVFACDGQVSGSPGLKAALEPLAFLWTAPPTLSDVEPGAFAVTATMPFPCMPYVFRPRATVAGAALTVRVEGRYQNGCPHDVTGTASFRVAVAAIPPGTYEVRLVRTHRDWDIPPDTTYFGVTVVP